MISVSPRISGNVPIRRRQDNSSFSLKKSSTLAQNRLSRALGEPSSAAPARPVAVVLSSPSARLLDREARTAEGVKETDAFGAKSHQKSEMRDNRFEYFFVEIVQFR
jgi:hypothetical protein